MIDEGETGLLVPVEEAALRTALQRLASDPARAKEMGTKAREIALARYSSERMVDAYLALYAQATR